MHRYEWQSRGSAHIHGFMWLPNAPDMKTLDWENATEVHNAKDFFDQFILLGTHEITPNKAPSYPTLICLIHACYLLPTFKKNHFQDYT